MTIPTTIVAGNVNGGRNNPSKEKTFLKDPNAREILALACYQALVKHLHANI